MHNHAYTGDPGPKPYAGYAPPEAHMNTSPYVYPPGPPQSAPGYGGDGYDKFRGPITAQPVVNMQNVNTAGQQPVPTVTVLQAPSTYQRIKPPSYIGFSIFTCLCCFWPLGLVALFLSCMSDNDPDYEGARKKGHVALILNIINVIVAPIVVIIIVVVKVVVADESTTSERYYYG